MPTNIPCSVALQPGPNDAGKVLVSIIIIFLHSVHGFEMFWKTQGYSSAVQACGVDFEVKAYIANEPDNGDEVIEKKYVLNTYSWNLLLSQVYVVYLRNTSILFLPGLRDTCRLMIRKIQFAPVNNKAGPKADISKAFMMSDKPVHLEASLEKEVHWGLQPSIFNIIVNHYHMEVTINLFYSF